MELSTLPLLKDLNDAARRELAARGIVRSFAPGETLWRAGAEPRGLFVILKGEVRVVRVVNGRRHVVHVEGAGGTLGEVPVFGGGVYPATAIATRRSACLVLTRDAVAAVIRADPEFAFRLLGRLAARVRHLIGRLDGMAGHTVTHRLAGWLWERHTAAGGQPFTLGGSQAELAEELGTVREVVVKSLRQLRRAGLIRSTGAGRFEVTDPAGLQQLSVTSNAERLDRRAPRQP